MSGADRSPTDADFMALEAFHAAAFWNPMQNFPTSMWPPTADARSAMMPSAAAAAGMASHSGIHQPVPVHGMPYQWPDIMNFPGAMHPYMMNPYATTAGQSGVMPHSSRANCPPLSECAGSNRNRRRRILFEPFKIQIMEQQFQRKHHITPSQRQELSRLTGLTSNQIKIWFQNRRYKEKKKEADRRFMQKNPQLAGAAVASAKKEPRFSESSSDDAEEMKTGMLKCADDSPPGQYGSNASGSCSSGVTAAGNLSLAATPSETLPEDLHKQQEAFYNHQRYSLPFYPSMPMSCWNQSLAAAQENYPR